MNTTIKQTLKTTLFGVSLLALASCKMGQSSTTLQPGAETPAASAQVKYDAGEDGNNDVALQVEHLPPPSALGDELSTFVVWMTPQGSDQPTNIGELDYDPVQREGKLDITTPYDKFTLTVTAEPVSNPIERGDKVVASGEVDTLTHQD